MIRDFLLLVAAILMLTPAGRDATAQAVPAEAQDRELIIGTKLAPPFALKDRDGRGPASASSCGATLPSASSSNTALSRNRRFRD